jgi:hypothetical protein
VLVDAPAPGRPRVRTARRAGPVGRREPTAVLAARYANLPVTVHVRSTTGPPRQL